MKKKHFFVTDEPFRRLTSHFVDRIESEKNRFSAFNITDKNTTVK